MNRFKKYLRSKGIKLECDYPALPWCVSKAKSPFEPGYISVEGVSVNSERATFTVFYNILSELTKVNRDGTLSEIWDDDDPPFMTTQR